MRTIEVPPDEPFVLQPRDFVLAVTLESLELDADVLGRLKGRSSLGRLGIIVHGTAGLFDPDWTGKAHLGAEQSEPYGGGPLSRHAHLLVYLRTALVALGGALPAEAGNKYAGQLHPLANRLGAEVAK